MARPVTVAWGGGMKAQATIGPHRVVFDASAEVGGTDTGPSPGELLLGAVGA
ncbi:MAG: OsmC family protein [Candidatus Rokuibacteriota bacterium]